MAKYDPLREHLRKDGSRRITMTFEQIGVLVDGLPPSAFEYRQWWENQAADTHVNADAWMAAGYRVATVDLTAKRVTFEQQ